jgi:hypothetical protein
MNSTARNRPVALDLVWGVALAGPAGVLHGMVFDVVRLRSRCGFAAVNLSGFSAAAPADVFEFARGPGIFEVSGVKGSAW